MIDVKEVLRQWLMGAGKKAVARQVGVDVKTVRRYVAAAERCGLELSVGVAALTEELLGRVIGELGGWRQRERGETWEACRGRREGIASLLEEGVKLRKVERMLKREGTEVPYATLHRYAVSELGFGKPAATIAVLEGEPGEELQVDTGWVGWLWGEGKRRLKAWIFTAVRSRHRFVYPTLRERTEDAIEACEAAWGYYGGVFRVLLPDNTKAIVVEPGDLAARIQRGFQEYAQARGFVVDPARVRRPKDKGRVERSVRHVREDCFGGERLKTIEEARRFAEQWCLAEYGMRRHGRTQRPPAELFLAEEKEKLLPAPTDAYDVPRWSSITVDRDQYATVEKGFYSLPEGYGGSKLTTRADTQTVRLYKADGALVKVHARVSAGERSTDPSDFPEARRIYAHRDVETLKRKAREHGESVGEMAERILEGPLPWTRMRRVYALIGLGSKYGSQRLDEACRMALEAEMLDVVRLKRLLARGTGEKPPERPEGAVVPIARYLRPRSHFALGREA